MSHAASIPQAPARDDTAEPQRTPLAGSGARALSPAEEERYSRQILFHGLGADGQLALARAHVAVVGCGATGAAVASLLARAGVGRLSLVDRDIVEPSNLQRQVLFDEDDARDATPKAEAARRQIARFNSAATVHAHIADLVPGNIHELLGAADLIVDGTDNFETRFLINDYAVQQGKPWIYTAAVAGQLATMNVLPAFPEPRPWQPTACLACLFPEPPAGAGDTCDTSGILPTAVNLVASIAATEALKFLSGNLDAMRRTLLSLDLWPATAADTLSRSEIRSANAPRDGCEVCGERQFRQLAGDARPQITLCGRNAVQIHARDRRLDLAELRARLASHPEVQDLRSNELLLRFRRGALTLTLFPDGRALVQGTTDPALARSLYARFVGI